MDENKRNEKVQVHCRIKPYLSELNDVNSPEINESKNDNITFLTNSDNITLNSDMANISFDIEQNKIFVKTEKSETKEFLFDSIISPSCLQAHVYHKTSAPIVKEFLEGYNGTIIAYGQTGSGKTYSMLGPQDVIEDEEKKGIIPRSLEDIFNCLNKIPLSGENILLKVSYVQIYCERIHDLLSPDTPPSRLNIREDSERGIYIEGACLTQIKTSEDCLRCLNLGNSNRQIAYTNMNATSSRSHAIFCIQMERKEYNSASDSKQIKVSQLCMVDLAGSERVDKSLVRGNHFNELKSINLSLSALGNCVSALSQGRQHIPYRDSKLTRLLQYGLGRNAKTSMIITVSSDHQEIPETLSTCYFGQRAKLVPVQAHLNIQPDYKALYDAIQSSFDQRDDRINELEIQLNNKNMEIEKKDDKIETLMMKNKSLEFQLGSLKVKLKNIQLDQNKNINDEKNNALENYSNEIEKLLEDHKMQLVQQKNKYDSQLESYKLSAQMSIQEWNHIENQLSSEKKDHLNTITNYRKCREKLSEVENESNERISELLHKVNELKEQKNEIHVNNINQLNNKLKKTESELLILQKRVNDDYVSREKIDEMESLYEDAIAKIQQRVISLEGKNIAKKATPTIGRVKPRRSNNNQQLNPIRFG